MGDQFKELEKMRREVAKIETKRDQDDHQITRLENKIEKIEKVSLKQRTHLLLKESFLTRVCSHGILNLNSAMRTLTLTQPTGRKACRTPKKSLDDYSSTSVDRLQVIS